MVSSGMERILSLRIIRRKGLNAFADFSKLGPSRRSLANRRDERLFPTGFLEARAKLASYVPLSTRRGSPLEFMRTRQIGVLLASQAPAWNRRCLCQGLARFKWAADSKIARIKKPATVIDRRQMFGEETTIDG
jgi:hypothetical protein